MASVTITIPDALVPRLIAAMNWRYPETVGKDPATEFKRLTGERWREILVDYEGYKAELPIQQQLSVISSQARSVAFTDGSAIG